MAAAIVKKNFPYFKEQFSAAFGNSSVVIKSICVAIVCFHFLKFSGTAIDLTTVTPGYVLPPNFWVWTFFTFPFLELHTILVIVDLIVIVLSGKLLEPLWGALEVLSFFVLINFFVGVYSTFFYMFLYSVSKYVDFLYATHIGGLAGYLAGVTVAVKQIMPDNIMINSPFGKLRNHHIPLLALITVIILHLLGALDGQYPVMFSGGILFSWTYLRFYQKHSNGNRGDLADNFSFASLFPSTLQPVISIISNSVFMVLVKIKICKKPQRKYDISSPHTITVSLPGTDPQDAERRKQLALKALNDRLSKTDNPVSWPSMDDSPEAQKKPPDNDEGDTVPTVVIKNSENIEEKIEES